MTRASARLAIPVLLVLLSLPSLLASRAAAEGGGGADPMREACGADAERLCPGAPNPGMCLHEHWDELSEGCRGFKERMRKRWESKRGFAGKPSEKKSAAGKPKKARKPVENAAPADKH